MSDDYDDPYGNGTLVPDDRWGRSIEPPMHGERAEVSVPDTGRLMPKWLRNELRILRLRTWQQRWWTLANWWSGYRFSAVRRCRYCDHTTPHHYGTCRLAAKP